jgi:sec-independent protein translocase protein TatB
VVNLDPGKLLVIAVVAIILLGPDKLPQVARQAGAAWRAFNEFRHRMESEVRSSIPDLPSTHDLSRLARSPTALLDHLSKMGPDDVPAPDGTIGQDAPVSSDPDVASPEGDPSDASPGDVADGITTGDVVETVPSTQTAPGAAPGAPVPAPATEAKAPQRTVAVVTGDPTLN